jgi:hypothetical protein
MWELPWTAADGGTPRRLQVTAADERIATGGDTAIGAPTG